MATKAFSRSGDAPLPQDLTSVFFAKMGSVELLTAAEEVALAKAIEAGRLAEMSLENGTPAPEASKRIDMGHRAAERFVAANLRLVVRMAADMAGRAAVPLDDLVQEGTVGLIHAVERFDWRRGYRFSTYATWWIRRELQHGMAVQSRTIRLPFAVHAAVARTIAASARLESETGRAPTVVELAAATNLSAKEVARALHAERTVVSIDAAIGDRARSEVIADGVDVAEQVAAELDSRHVVAQVRECLDDRGWQIVARRFGLLGTDPATFETIGAELNLSRETVRLALNEALSTLRTTLAP